MIWIKVMILFYVYMLKCSDNTLYTGYTVNLEARINSHNKGKASKYTRGRLPVELVYYEELSSKSEALKRECAIKKLTRDEKLELIKRS
ncbi:MAG: GIY-YIG nuclease family protein [Tissierellaceae bacterium]|jgi:putative endonuclease